MISPEFNFSNATAGRLRDFLQVKKLNLLDNSFSNSTILKVFVYVGKRNDCEDPFSGRCKFRIVAGDTEKSSKLHKFFELIGSPVFI